ncbi:fibrobacter succinogenes major paralogous domain-containing protein [Chitinophaga rhizophila]|uniref:Fibrobacter succinogenes major paralogous domain-containing protein n=1 Tax=Chitinophaga rhizophila TaxID=2866212 RepID=A0ABS7GC23_9BACT|nr:fibrobacter succinogenes major paralogous domain-containing protein [Chitinophaga rhizophila]MBW8684966.1 fibrobacter succinogenes major paralogous domain-containing protein [Chitinophaga rhizophila]
MKYLISFLLLLTGCAGADMNTVQDIDGNVYPVVRIGKQLWMAKNLEVTRYRNGDSILLLHDDIKWSTSQEGAYCMYQHDTGYVRDYGLLYNWHAVSDSRNIAPEGWRIPTSEDLAILVASLRGDTVAGVAMKTAAPGYWHYPYTGADSSSGFAALPGGYRYGPDGSFHTLGSNGYWWHNRGSYELYAWSNRFYSYFADVQRDPEYMEFGFSVRCIKE